MHSCLFLTSHPSSSAKGNRKAHETTWIKFLGLPLYPKMVDFWHTLITMSIRTSVPRCSKGMFRVLRDPFFSLYGCSEFPILLCRGDLSWDSDGSRRLERLWSFCGLAPPHVMPLGGTQHDSGRSTKPRQKEGCIMTQRRNASNGLVPMCVCVCVCHGQKFIPKGDSHPTMTLI